MLMLKKKNLRKRKANLVPYKECIERNAVEDASIMDEMMEEMSDTDSDVDDEDSREQFLE